MQSYGGEDVDNPLSAIGLPTTSFQAFGALPEGGNTDPVRVACTTGSIP